MLENQSKKEQVKLKPVAEHQAGKGDLSKKIKYEKHHKLLFDIFYRTIINAILVLIKRIVIKQYLT